GTIQELVNRLIPILSKDKKIAYLDADHQSGDQPVEEVAAQLGQGLHQSYTDKIHFHRFDTRTPLESFQFRSYFNEQDVLLLNGNHFQGNHQIVLIDPRKEKSLRKRAEQLTEVQLLVLAEGVESVLPYVQDLVPNWADLPVLKIGDTAGIAAFLKTAWAKTEAPLYGLVLAGGKSTRMGQDKGLLEYYGQPQRSYVQTLLEPFCDQVYLSLRSEEQARSEDRVIYDSFKGLGPFGAILSAFREAPDAAWLVVACDLPLLDQPTLDFLVQHRDRSAYATAFLDSDGRFPEPLISIWEPRSYSMALQFLAQGYSCPRKVLINSPIRLLEAPDTRAFHNVNRPEEYQQVKKKK
ncbi:MAG: NTP transferase domain-containing protein, partial [Phaeodactylibacter sp.]|nr:NTP transferase domain-containing protein [Phaeodactylibacter sp.]